MSEHITRIELVSHLHDGIYRADREMYAVPDTYETADRAHLALALDAAEYRRTYLAGGYGGIGCGETHVTVYFGDDDEAGREVLEEDRPGRGLGYGLGYDEDTPESEYITEAEAFAACAEDGALTWNEIQKIEGDVWDGHNHVTLTAQRARDFAPDEPRTERYDWGTLTYMQGDDSSGMYECIGGYEVADGWVCLGWGDVGNRAGGGADEFLTEEQFDALNNRRLREDGDLTDVVGREVQWITEDDSDTVAAFCRAEDADAIRDALASIEEPRHILVWLDPEAHRLIETPAAIEPPWTPPAGAEIVGVSRDPSDGQVEVMLRVPAEREAEIEDEIDAMDDVYSCLGRSDFEVEDWLRDRSVAPATA